MRLPQSIHTPSESATEHPFHSLRAISLFSGVGGFEIGFDRAGIETVLQVEQDPWCLSVLARHWPHTARLTDVRSVSRDQLWRSDAATGGSRSVTHGADGLRDDGNAEPCIDLIYGGFPCQDVSVAGKRAGLGGARSGLWFEFWRVLSELRPRWTVIENVAGLLSSNGGRDLGAILGGLEELGFWWAYGVLDAQHFGVAQRRRRVFIVGGPDRRACEQILAVCESCGGHPAAGREARQGVAYSLAASARGTGDGHGNAWNSNYVTADTVRSHPRPGSNSVGNLTVAGAVSASYAKGPGFSGKDELLIPFDTTQITSKTNRSQPQPGDPCHPLAAQGHAPAIAQTLTSGGNPNSNLPGRHHEDDDNLVAFNYAVQGSERTRPVRAGHQSGAMNTNGQEAIAHPSFGVRRLTPTECERLQGWPDDHTRWTDDGREVADSIRYRMIGNGVASPCAEWLGHRLVWVDAHLRGDA